MPDDEIPFGEPHHEAAPATGDDTTKVVVDPEACRPAAAPNPAAGHVGDTLPDGHPMKRREERASIVKPMHPATGDDLAKGV